MTKSLDGLSETLPFVTALIDMNDKDWTIFKKRYKELKDLNIVSIEKY